MTGELVEISVGITLPQQDEMKRLKSYFPFRIVYGAVNHATGEFICAAVSDKRKINQLLRKGFTVWTM